jgi:hypothetical protein
MEAFNSALASMSPVVVDYAIAILGLSVTVVPFMIAVKFARRLKAAT